MSIKAFAKFRVTCVSVLVILMAGLLSAQSLTDPETEKKIDKLLSRMTLEEKIGQMNQYTSFYDVTGPAPEAGTAKQRFEQLRHGLVGSMLNIVGVEETRRIQQEAVENSRLGIPLIFGLDVIHGFKTMFPIPLAEAASWDPEAIETSARVAATEAAAAGLHWTFAPMVDICRDARWGRIMEGAGEDPYLGAQVAAARVRGFQGSDLAAPDTIAACAKHYAAYGFAEAGRDYNTVDVSEYTLRNIILPPFRAAAEAGVASFMNAFNEIGGIPATGSIHLQREILKGEWGFQGLVVSDWGSIGEMITHGFATDSADAARIAIRAGSDMDMESRAYVEQLKGLVESGQVEEKLLDDAVRRILRVKYKLGLFDDPFRYSNPEREESLILTERHLEIARDVARKSIVLLKNQGSLLPLDKNLESIAVIGPLAADKDTPLGSWRARAEENSAVSLLEGIRAAVGPATEVRYAEGAKLIVGGRSFVSPSHFNEDDTSGFAEAVEAARKSTVAVLAVGEDAFQSGEGRSQVDIGLKGVQKKLLRAVYQANPRLVVVLMTGRPLVINWMAENVPAILNTWHLGSQAGNAIADILFGDYTPSGKLPVSFPRHVGQLPLYYNHKNTGRPNPQPIVFWSHYTDEENSPLFPFGFGLSYTTFEYSDIRLNHSELTTVGEIRAMVTVTNTGKRRGAEVVQLYIRDPVASATRPVLELKGFQKIELDPGESRKVEFKLTARDLAFYTPRGRWESEPGAFKVYIGPNSANLKEAEFTLR